MRFRPGVDPLECQREIVSRAPLNRTVDRRAALRPVDPSEAKRVREIERVGADGLRNICARLDLVGAVADVVDASGEQDSDIANAGVPAVAVKRVARPKLFL